MQTVSAVVTTGIYCRPGCGARPHADNVTHFPLAAAAEAAGYRARLRCRPYRIPVRVLDRLGTGVPGAAADSRRRARRRNRSHPRPPTAGIGSSPPSSLHRSAGGNARRAGTFGADHLPRRLLDDTDFTIIEIAFAADPTSHLRKRSRRSSTNSVMRCCMATMSSRSREMPEVEVESGRLHRLRHVGSRHEQVQL